MPRYVGEEERITPGGLVWIVGAASGARRAVIVGAIVAIRVTYFNHRALVFRNCFELRGVDGAKPSIGGDSGAIVMADDGAVLGMIFGGAADMSVSVAFPMRPAIQALGCKLVTFSF